MLTATILSDYPTRNTPIHHGSQLAADDPWHIAGTIASVSPPPTIMLVKEHVKRFHR